MRFTVNDSIFLKVTQSHQMVSNQWRQGLKLVLVNLFLFSKQFRNFVGGLDGEGKERGQYLNKNIGSRADIFCNRENFNSLYSAV